VTSAKATLLVELLTEELPPKALSTLGFNFASAIREELVALKLAGASGKYETDLATPRRLAVIVQDVAESAAAEEREVTGPSTAAPAAAVAGFAKKHGVAADALVKRSTPKGEVFAARVKAGGAVLTDILAEVVEKAIKKLPIPKVMRWGSGDAQFVRPVHGLVMLHGERLVPGTVLGLSSQRSTLGHRFLSSGPMSLKNADEYEARLRDEGMVVARFQTRKAEIGKQLAEKTRQLGASLGAEEQTAPLLEEVTALVEFPAVYVGAFEPAFLDVPQECLILTMRQNQKYFPLFDGTGKLLPKFLIVSNMKVADPRHIVGGNERVVRPRLEDARFFYDQDRKQRLESRVPQLAKVVYHRKLGSQLERVERIQLLAGSIARALKADFSLAERAAWLAKADLQTGMVGEFPELQGVMGRYYALNDNEKPVVADAIEAHYRPRFAGDELPQGPVACAVALADKLDAIAGLFGIGEQPTGEKDPFGLRRAALGVIRILVEHQLPLSLQDLVNEAFGRYPQAIGPARADAQTFILNRFEGYLKDRGFSTLQVNAVLSMNPAQLSLVPRQLEAVKAFQALPEAESLAAANKRIANILKQAEAKGESSSNAKLNDLKEPAERSLFQALQEASAKAATLFERGDYTGYLKTFAVLKAPVDAFFESVMVMVEEKALRMNRLALLRDLRDAMNRVADISKLAVEK
jgi:glycyl-tRNA synthetase beta chain